MVLYIYVFSGDNVNEIFQQEIGLHRWQRIPPTEKRGRVHTSTITVALIEENDYKDIKLYPHEYRLETTRGTGNGGQKRNKTESCVVVTHIVTGIKVRRDSRSQLQNKEAAIAELTERVNNFYRTGHDSLTADNRSEQIGDGSRSDKRRTYRVKDDLVVDHITNKTASLKDILRGKIELLS